jgi:hypothetical protein
LINLQELRSEVFHAAKCWGMPLDKIVLDNRFYKEEPYVKRDSNGNIIICVGSFARCDDPVREILDYLACLKATPKTLYVHRPLLNYAAVVAWAKANGFASTLNDDMHVTVAFSRQPVDWSKVKPQQDTITITNGDRSLAKLGATGDATVLHFDPSKLVGRWNEFIDAGASWDWPDYKPHITISYQAGDVDSIAPYDGTLVFGPEVFAELKEDWKNEIVEADFDESKHPRDEAGRFSETGGEGGGAESDGGGKGEHPGEGYSSSARVINGVIHTSSVYDAQRALSENRKVELNQPRSVSVLLKRLGEVSKKMIAEGKDAPLFNLCNVSVKGTNLFCADTIGIPRVKMPQLDDDQTKAFVKHLKEMGFKVEKDKVHANHLRATQNELNGVKVAATAEKMRGKEGKISKRLVVSKDDYILDGHHHWAAKVGLDAEDGSLTNDTKVRVSRVNISITKLLEEAEKFTGGKGKVGVDLKSIGDIISDLVREWDESEHPRDSDGKFAFGSGGSESNASEFIEARDKSERINFLSPLKPQDLSQHTLIMNKEKTVGVAVDKQGDLQNLFNNGGPKGACADMVVAAIGHGAKTLDCYDGFLPDYYRNFGFRETGRMIFNPAFAHDWDIAKHGSPDVVFMAWNGYVDGASSAVARAKGPREDWIVNDPSSKYETDFDTAKAASRETARGSGGNRSAGAQSWPQAFGAGDQSGARSGEGHRRTVALRDFDESKHPRGQPENAGQFGSGGGGGDDTAPAAPAEQAAPADYGFSKKEKDVIGSYITSSEKINKYYRDGQKDKSGKSNKELDAAIDSMNSALKKSALGADTTLFRGISECPAARELRKNAESMIGKSVPLGGFQSTTYDEDIALEFVSGYNSKVVLEITAPKGTHAIDMQPYADNFAKQKEFLLGEGSLKIDSVERTGSGSAVLYVKGTYKEK